MEQHFSHEHPLILNEVYIAKSGDVCCGCREEIVSCRSFVYSCSRSSNYSTSSTTDDELSCVKFLLHKSCAELPPTLEVESDDGAVIAFKLHSSQSLNDLYGRLFKCRLCSYRWSSWPSGFTYICSIDDEPLIACCAICTMEFLEQDRIYQHHPAHPQHKLKFVQYLSSFKYCHACRVDDNIKDLSYICTECPFWIHKSCADAPASFQFHFHDKHPLQLSFSLPQFYEKFPRYRKFIIRYCRFCNKRLRDKDWLYSCPKCRFFAHFHCARSNEKIRLIEDEIIYDSEVVHLPAADESSADQLAEQFVMAMSTIVITTNNCFRHWAHDEHDLQLMTVNELNKHQKHDAEALLLLCDGCVKPIRTDHQDNQFYGCVPCNYFMHNACAGLPREIEHHLHPGITLYADKYSSPLDYFDCDGCGVFTNGIAYHDGEKPLSRYNNVHIGCLTLPKKIKHEAHGHQLNQVFNDEHACKACGDTRYCNNYNYKYRCEKCGYYICAGCIIQPKTAKHRWDPHPLSLIYDPGMVSSDHEHEFVCECCSQVIDCTNIWFYHCTECDLSFHLLCFEFSGHSLFSSIKFGATVIKDKLHHHSLTFVLNKEVVGSRCAKCFSTNEVLLKPVLECVPCKAIFCLDCCK